MKAQTIISSRLIWSAPDGREMRVRYDCGKWQVILPAVKGAAGAVVDLEPAAMDALVAGWEKLRNEVKA